MLKRVEMVRQASLFINIGSGRSSIKRAWESDMGRYFARSKIIKHRDPYRPSILILRLEIISSFFMATYNVDKPNKHLRPKTIFSV